MTEQTRRVAIVTGGANGIGWASAQRFAQEGYSVAVADLHADRAQQRAQELGAAHVGIAADVAIEADVIALIRACVERFGRLDVLVNNAGNSDQPYPTIEQNIDAFDRLVDIHLRGTFLACRRRRK
jgi:NAD(P)-dependent dehydrogenase (short-subunit alcohol dehydrogenase family)